MRTTQGPMRTTRGPSDAAVADWSRGYDLESETWEWNGSTWSVNGAARLPGLVDPALAFDGARSRVVLYGGAPQKLSCQQNGTGILNPDEDVYCVAPLQNATITWEYDARDDRRPHERDKGEAENAHGGTGAFSSTHRAARAKNPRTHGDSRDGASRRKPACIPMTRRA